MMTPTNKALARLREALTAAQAAFVNGNPELKGQRPKGIPREPALASTFDAIARPFTAAFYAELPVAQSQWLAAHDAYVTLPQEERNA